MRDESSRGIPRTCGVTIDDDVDRAFGGEFGSRKSKNVGAARLKRSEEAGCANTHGR